MYIRMFFILVITLYTSRIIFQALGVEDFGIYNVVGGVIVMLSFLSNSMSLAVNRFLAFEMGLHNDSNLDKIFSMSINIHLLLAVIIIILGETVGIWFINTQLVIPNERLAAANWIFQFSIITIILEVVKVPYIAIALSHEDMHIYAYSGIIEGIMKLLIAFIIFHFTGDKLILYGFLLAILNATILLFYFVWSKYNYTKTKYQLIWDKRLFKEMSSFAGISLMGNSSSVIVSQGQNILLNVFFGPVLNAARGISFQIQGALSLFASGIFTAVTPQITKSFASNDSEYLMSLITRSSLYAILGLLILIIPVSFELPYILYLWLGDSYPPVTIIFSRLILVSLLLYSVSKPVMIAIQSSGQILKMHLYCSIVTILNLPIDYVLLSVYHLEAYWIFIVYAITGLIYIAIVLYIAKKTIKLSVLHFLKKVIFPILFVGFVTTLVIYMLHVSISSLMIRLLFECILSIILVTSLTFLLFLSNSERLYIINKLSSIINYRA